VQRYPSLWPFCLCWKPVSCSAIQTDSSRAKSLELHIQARVREELDRLRQRELKTIEEIEKRLADEFAPPPTPSPSSSQPPNTQSPAPSITTPSKIPGSLDLDAPRIPFAGRQFDTPSTFPVVPEQQPPPPAATTTIIAPSSSPIDRDLSRDSVLRDIDRLRHRLESRKKLSALDEAVDHARADVIQCLRDNDRRPLDCWKQVETFKAEVARLERNFVDKVVG
jgi:MICOS complex subunit MIC19